MRLVYAFLLVSVDGYHADATDHTDWFVLDEEFERYSQGQKDDIDTIVMGRRTFEMMADFWPTPEAYEADPIVAGFMNDLPKIVASRTLTEHPWGPNTFVPDDIEGHLTALKVEPGKSIAIFGSSNLVAHLLPTGVIDELRVIVNPLALGSGQPLLAGMSEPVRLQRVGLRAFDGGNVLLTYRPEI